MSDPLDVVFVTDKDEARRLKRSRQLVALAKYLDNMPMELKPLFKERFSLIDNAELAQLRADLQAAQERIVEQARQLDEARKLEQYVRGLNDYEIEFTACPVCDYPPIVCECGYVSIRAWLAANPAPPEQQP